MKKHAKRQKFTCWKCGLKYSLYVTFSDEQQLIVACPYCGAEGVAGLRRGKKITVLRGEGQPVPEEEYEYDLPEVIATREPDETSGGSHATPG